MCMHIGMFMYLEKYVFIFILRDWLNLLMKAENQAEDKEIL